MLQDNNRVQKMGAKQKLENEFEQKIDFASQLIDCYSLQLENFLQKKKSSLELFNSTRLLTHGLLSDKINDNRINSTIVKFSVNDLLNQILSLNKVIINRKKLKIQFNSNKSLRATGVVQQIRDVLQILITAVINNVDEKDVLIISQKRERSALMLFISLASTQKYENSYNVSKISEDLFNKVFSLPTVYLIILKRYCKINQLQIFIGINNLRIIDIRFYLTYKD